MVGIAVLTMVASMAKRRITSITPATATFRLVLSGDDVPGGVITAARSVASFMSSLVRVRSQGASRVARRVDAGSDRRYKSELREGGRNAPESFERCDQGIVVDRSEGR